jgi:hypothetical protein
MMRTILAILAVLAVASAFTSPAPRGMPAQRQHKQLFMFSADDKPQPLTEVKADEPVTAMESESSSEGEDPFLRKKAPTMMARNRNTGEMMEVEMNESFLANEKFELNWWAWVGFVAFPLILLGNDALHFLPTDGPLGFLSRI